MNVRDSVFTLKTSDMSQTRLVIWCSSGLSLVERATTDETSPATDQREGACSEREK